MLMFINFILSRGTCGRISAAATGEPARRCAGGGHHQESLLSYSVLGSVTFWCGSVSGSADLYTAD
jgi:hypothetical protein